MIFDQQLKITLRKSSDPSEKICSPLKIQKVQIPPCLSTLKIFQPLPPAERGMRGRHCSGKGISCIWIKNEYNSFLRGAPVTINLQHKNLLYTRITMKMADLVEYKVQLAPFAVNAIKKTKWPFSLWDWVLNIQQLP